MKLRSSGLQRHVFRREPDVSEEHVSIFRVEARKQLTLPAPDGLLLGLLFNLKDGGDIVFRNVGHGLATQ
jgi:hypothetical protein